MATRSRAKPSSRSRPVQRPQRAEVKRSRTTQCQETVTAGSKQRKSDESYMESGDDPKIRFQKQETAFIKFLENHHAPHFPHKIKPSVALFRMYFNALKEGNLDRITDAAGAIDKLFAIEWDEVKKNAGNASPLDHFVADQTIKTLQTKWRETLDEINKPMAPSYFARSAGWALAQLGPARIHCLRPTDCSGLPISLLNPAFAKFKFILAQPMPFNSDATRAMAVAWNLCMTMPKHFKDDTLRKEALFTHLRGLFLGRSFTTTSFGSANPAGALLRPDGSIDVVVELKNEPGNAGDVYMQCASSFDAAAIHQLKNQASAECAAFVISVDGPNLLICGGFKDDGVSIVEPLSHWCSMLPDGLGERQEVLAKHLYALHASLSLLKAPARGKASKCPRIYDSFQTIDAKARPLEFISPYKPRGSHCLLLFKAKAAITDEPEEVLVKVVHGRYGEYAHRAAAQQGFAPKLYGVAEVNGAPTAYVMEFLSKEKGWMPLRYTSLQTPEQWKLLEAQSTKFLAFMRENRLVHGDLRPNNILLRVKDASVELRILDWDWAGEAGSARYPLNLNQEAKLPGDAGGLITEEDDFATMTDWLKKIRDPSFRLLF